MDAGSCYADENIESSHAVEQTTCTIIKLPALLSYFEQIRTFRTVGTQTEDLRIQGTARIQPDDINELLHLEDCSYSLARIMILQQMTIKILWNHVQNCALQCL